MTSPRPATLAHPETADHVDTGTEAAAAGLFASVQRRTMIVLVITQIIGTIGVGVAPSIGVLLASEVTDNEAWAGLARTASTLGAALFGLPLGGLAQKHGRRFALSLGWFVAALGSGILLFAAQLSMVVPLFIGLLLIGSGAAVSLQARFAAIDLAEPQHKARSLSLVVWVGTLGTLVGPNLGAPGAILGAATGLTVYASAFLITAVCLAVAGTVVFFALRPDPLLFFVAHSRPHAAAAQAGAQDQEQAQKQPQAPKRPNQFKRVLAEVRTNAAARTALIAIVSGQIVMVSIMTMTPVHMMHTGGNLNIVGLTISIHILGMFAFAPAVGWLVDRYGHRFTIWLGIGIFAASLVIAALRPDQTEWMITALFLLGLGWSFVNVAGSALFALAVSDEVRATSQGGVDAMANLCGAVAAFAAGPMLAASNFTALSLIAIGVLVPISVLLLRRIPLARARRRGGCPRRRARLRSRSRNLRPADLEAPGHRALPRRHGDQAHRRPPAHPSRRRGLRQRRSRRYGGRYGEALRLGDRNGDRPQRGAHSRRVRLLDRVRRRALLPRRPAHDRGRGHE